MNQRKADSRGTESKAGQWSRLDNAAKIFPSNTGKEDTKVFRFSCQLKEAVDKGTLQLAVYDTVEAYPFFQSVLKRGVFWYYMEGSDLDPVVKEEERLPCSMLYDKNAKHLLFEVSYYKKRINLEVFHGLTDGTGALQFLRTLVCNYLSRRHPEDCGGRRILPGDSASPGQRMADSFQKYYGSKDDAKEVRENLERRPVRKERKKGASVYKLRGVKAVENRMHIFEGQVSASALLAKAREYHTTITVLLASLLILAIHEEMPVRKEKHPITVSIPVNLRKYFQSESARNFFSVVNIGFCFAEESRDRATEERLADVALEFGTGLAAESDRRHMVERLNKLAALEHNAVVRILPLVLKDWILRFFYWKSERGYTTTLSNLGPVRMPEELVDYIDRFDVFNSTSNLQMCAISFRDRMNLSMTSRFSSTEIPKNFFRLLSTLGLDVTVVSNRIGGEE